MIVSALYCGDGCPGYESSLTEILPFLNQKNYSNVPT
jgi:hypothetical protein